jgi:hypothetical protein
VGVISISTLAALVVIPFRMDDGLRAAPGIARVSILAGLVLPAIAGLIAVLSLAGFLVVLAVACTMPGLAGHARTGWRAGRRLSKAEPRDGELSKSVRPPASWDDIVLTERFTETPTDLASLDDDALCLAWRRSFLLLKSSRSASDHLSIVEQRQRYLDELQRRSSDGLAAWLASGARASGNPRPYLHGHGRQAG